MPLASKAIANPYFLSSRDRIESTMAFFFPMRATIFHTYTMSDDCHSATINLYVLPESRLSLESRAANVKVQTFIIVEGGRHSN